MQLALANIAEERERVRRRRAYDSPRRARRSASRSPRPRGAARRGDAGAAPLARPRRRVRAHRATRPRRRAARSSTTSARCGTGARRPRRPAPRRRPSAPPPASRLRERLTLWWQTDAVRRVRPRVDGRGPPHAVLLRGRPVRRGRRPRRRARAPLRPRAAERRPRRALRQLGRRRHGRQPVASAPRRLTRDARAAPADWRSACCATRVDRARRRLLARRPTACRSSPAPAPHRSTATSASCPRSPSAWARATRTSRCARKLRFVAARLARRRATTPGRVPGRRRARAPTSSWSASSLGSATVADGAIQRLLIQVRTFGFHLAKLDVRQSADVAAGRGGGARPRLRATRTSTSASRC